MTCIDCGELRPMMLTQTASVGKWKREWTVCVKCARAYERTKGAAK